MLQYKEWYQYHFLTCSMLFQSWLISSFGILGLCIWWMMKYSTFLISNLPSFSTHTQSPLAHVQQHPSYHFYSLLVNIFLLHLHVFMASIRFTMLNTELFSPSDCFCISKGFQHWIRIQHLWLHTSASSMFVFAALKLCQISLTVKPQKGESKWKHIWKHQRLC